jgi:hypothetical protein
MKGKIHYGTRFSRDGELLLHSFADSDWIGDVTTRNNTFDYWFNLGSIMIFGLSRRSIMIFGLSRK